MAQVPEPRLNCESATGTRCSSMNRNRTPARGCAAGGVDCLQADIIFDDPATEERLTEVREAGLGATAAHLESATTHAAPPL